MLEYVESENVKNNVVKHTNTSYFTMVAKNERHESMQVPGLILETEVEIRRFMEAIKRKELKLAMKTETSQMKTSFNLSEAIRLLQNERCVIQRKD
jgi:hypothetical protein